MWLKLPMPRISPTGLSWPKRAIGRNVTPTDAAQSIGSAWLLLKLVSNYRGICILMDLPKSRVTSQGQISIPTKIRKKLGVGPGSVLEWAEQGENIIVRRAGQFTSSD